MCGRRRLANLASLYQQWAYLFRDSGAGFPLVGSGTFEYWTMIDLLPKPVFLTPFLQCLIRPPFFQHHLHLPQRCTDKILQRPITSPTPLEIKQLFHLPVTPKLMHVPWIQLVETSVNQPFCIYIEVELPIPECGTRQKGASFRDKHARIRISDSYE